MSEQAGGVCVCSMRPCVKAGKRQGGAFYVSVTNGVEKRDGELSDTSNEAGFGYASFDFDKYGQSLQK